MRERMQNEEKLDEAIGLLKLGVIDEREFDRRWWAAQLAGGWNLEDATDEHLAAMFAKRCGRDEALKAYIASLIVERGLAACGCEHRQEEVEAYALRWYAFHEQYKKESGS